MKYRHYGAIISSITVGCPDSVMLARNRQHYVYLTLRHCRCISQGWQVLACGKHVLVDNGDRVQQLY